MIATRQGRRLGHQTVGPAARIDSSTSANRFAKLSTNISASSRALTVVQLRIAPGRRAGRAAADRRPARARGTSKPNTSSVRNSARVELAGQRRAQHRARRLDRHPLPFAERAAGPAGVDEPHVARVLVELLAEHPRVHRRRLRQERLAEAGRERRLRLGDADLGAGELRGEAGEEVVERLLAREPARSAAGSRTRRR